MSKTVIVGAGVIGLACAYELARRGHQVTVVDKGEPGRGCSEGNAGWIVPSLSAPMPAPGLAWTSIKWMLSKESPLYVAPGAVPKLSRWLWRFWRYCNATDHVAGLHATAALNRLTFPLFDELARAGVSFELHRRGLLYAFLDASYAEKARAELAALREYGYAMPELLDGAAIRAIEPSLSEAVGAGFTVEQEWHVRPETLCDGYVTALRELGASVRTGVDVRGPLRGRDGAGIRGVETSAGPIESDQVLIAAGAWSGQVAESFGVRLPVQAGKGYSLTIPMTEVPVARPLYLGDAKVATTPFDGALRLAGTMELSGINTTLDRDRLEGILRSVDRYFAVPFARMTGREWVGMRPITPDGLPMLGRIGGRENLFIATGHAMLGVTLAPATGRVIAELMTKQATSVPVTAFEPERFEW